MPSPEQVKAPYYPEGESQIKLGPIESSILDEAFRTGIRDHGNGDQMSWPSYAQKDFELFTARRYGKSVKPPAETDGYQMSQWTLEFGVRKKTLLIDTGSSEVLRFDGEFTVPASFNDVSDIFAAYFNLNSYGDERRAQGWDPLRDYIFRQNGLL